MKYFTPELIVRMNSRSDQELAAALEEWEKSVDDYERHLSDIERKLPRSVRNFLSRWYLHDSEVLDIAQRNGFHWKRFLLIVLRVKDELVTLQYALAKPAEVEPPVLPQQFCSIQRLWKYDEIDV